MVEISTEDYWAGAGYIVFPCVLSLPLSVLLCYGARCGTNVCSPYFMQKGNKPQKDFAKGYKVLVGADPKVSAAPV